MYQEKEQSQIITSNKEDINNISQYQNESNLKKDLNDEGDNNSLMVDSNKLIIEGTITFNSGKTKNTKFIYEAKIEDHKFILEGLNADFATEKAFVLNCNLDTANRLVVESFNYKYTINNTLVEGLLK